MIKRHARLVLLLAAGATLGTATRGSAQTSTGRQVVSDTWIVRSETAAANAASSATAASGSASSAAGYAASASTSATNAATAQAGAQAAQTAAQLSAGVYATTTAGLAGTTNGQYFSIPSNSAGGYLDLYKNNAGVALYVNTYPSLTGVLAARVVGEVFAGLITPIATPGFPDGLHFSLTVAAGTKVRAAIPTQINQTTWPNPAEVTLTAGTFAVLDASGTPPNDAWWVYCDRAGALYVSTSVPSSEHIVLAYADYFVSANNFRFIPLRPTIHFLAGVLSNLQFRNTVLERSEFDFVRDFGGVGDGTTSNLPALTNLALYQVSRSATGLGQFTVRVPAGTYVLPTGTLTGINLQAVHFVGDDRATVIFKSSNLTLMSYFNFNYAENITFYNVTTAAYLPPDSVVFRHCVFKIDATASGLTALYWVTASPAAGGSATVEDNVFQNGTQVYIPIWINGAKNVTVRNNSLTGDASHMIRLAGLTPGGRVEITGNVITPGASGFTTGIFIGSDRAAPIENVFIQGNKVSGFNEEGISLDGFGNNSGLVPTICNGTVTSATNDVDGRLVITPSMVYHDGVNPNVACPVSLRSDWTTFYATLGQGTGTVAGTVAKIKTFDSIAGTITLDVFTPAGSVTVGGDFGVQAGFFGPVIRDNVLSAGYGAAFTYATALSIYLNVFGATIEGNTVYGGANGLNLAGGLMLSTYHTLAWNNVVRGNRFLAVNQKSVAIGAGGVIAARSYFGGHKQYGNIFEGNTIDGGAIYLEQQSGMRWDNEVQGASLTFKSCANTLPTADASQVGRRFMRITDDVNGNPTAIDYWMVKLSGGVYTWTAAP